MLLELVRLGDVPDLILFADTGGEKPSTYLFCGRFSAWCKRHGAPGITRVVYTRRDGSVYTLEEHCHRTHTLPSLAYGRKSCSMKFKRDPQNKYVNNWAPAREAWAQGLQVTKLIGFGIDERHRTFAAGDDAKYHYRYPLIEWGWGRDECVEAIERAGLPQPGKSACFFCPGSKPGEVLGLPCDLKERAVAIERAANTRGGVKGLGGSGFNWEALIRGDYLQERLSFMPPPPPCDCFDGEDPDA